jgi:hypothetical protein
MLGIEQQRVSWHHPAGRHDAEAARGDLPVDERSLAIAGGECLTFAAMDVDLSKPGGTVVSLKPVSGELGGSLSPSESEADRKS